MKFLGIEKKQEGRFINRYDISYETEEGKTKVYEMVSRDKEMDSFSRLHDREAEAVILVVHNEDNSRILLNREFRLAVGEWIYNFPAGMIDPGESIREAAARELREETGLHLDHVKDILRTSYSAIGFSNEKNICMVCTASGTIRKSDSAVEEIEAAWFTREEIRTLLKTQSFAGRTQSYCYLWAAQSGRRGRRLRKKKS